MAFENSYNNILHGYRQLGSLSMPRFKYIDNKWWFDLEEVDGSLTVPHVTGKD